MLIGQFKFPMRQPYARGLYDVQFQKISISPSPLPPQKGLEFPRGGGEGDF